MRRQIAPKVGTVYIVQVYNTVADTTVYLTRPTLADARRTARGFVNPRIVTTAHEFVVTILKPIEYYRL
jgi:hypothetical protein